MRSTKLRKPRIGEVVSYVLDSGPNFGQIRPAKIIEVFETHSGTENLRSVQAPILVNLKINTENIEDEVEDFPDAGNLKFSRCLNLENYQAPGISLKLSAPILFQTLKLLSLEFASRH